MKNEMTTGITPGVGSWEGRLADDGWALFIKLEGVKIEMYGLSWKELREKLAKEGLIEKFK